MKPKRFILTSFLVTSLCLCASLAMLLIAPLVLDLTAVRAEAISRLSAWAGSNIEISGPIRISYFPDVTFEAGRVGIRGLKRLDDVSGVTAEKLSAQLSWWYLLRGRIEIDELTLEEPRVTYRKQTREAGHPEQDSKMHNGWLDLLKRAPVTKLMIRRGKILFRHKNNEPQDGQDDITEIDATIDFKRNVGSASGAGQFSWRQKKLSFDFDTGEPERVATTAKVPIELNIAGALMKTSLNGELTIADGIQISGQQDIQISDVRGLADWVGYSIPPGPGLGNFGAVGAFSWNGAKLAFDKASITLDGNDATGALSLNLEKSRPLIEGTLDFDQISLAEYFTHSESPEESRPKFRKFLDLTLLKYFDADFRISSRKIVTDRPIAGRTAITLSVASRVLVAEIAETEIFGGIASGHLELAAITSFPRLTLSGHLSNFSTAELIGSFSRVRLLRGNADLSFDLTAQGRSIEHIVRSITGQTSLKINGDGIAMVNMKRVFSTAEAESAVGWNNNMLGETGFNQLNVSFTVKNGTIHTDDFIMKTGTRTYRGKGEIVLPANLLNWKLCRGDEAEA
ncbi:MAG: AsmA family protein, partial [Methyloligellaceae bacterium]